MKHLIKLLGARIISRLRTKWRKDEPLGRFRAQVLFQRIPLKKKRDKETSWEAITEESRLTIIFDGVILQQEAEIMQNLVHGILKTGGYRIMMDLSKVPVISKRGIDALMTIRKQSQIQGCKVEIKRIHPVVRLTLEEQGLDKFFNL
ncbi:STAS domain-containing protein [candidate division KSB1 bacterium]|nr:STAS domain-containing protein [candidate division KSB1 bacterium]NIR70293.1 STAS domain-containing protein [candidate division KSB1 bacterium]NIT71389.1 STAS domain-containing protein [candidate division KSB1 bacterium]NIU25074.1 STAS domain-containing protein [candidate division KSB1 bacterium]NIU91303.1 STAS domain-containing protein [candidate division KSB1 bacterium]